jgi:hypothetical protein
VSRWDDPLGGVTLYNDRNVDLYEIVLEAAAFLRGKLTVGQADVGEEPLTAETQDE